MTLNKLELMSLVVTINRDIFRLHKEMQENANLIPAAKSAVENLSKILEQANDELKKD